MIENNLSGKNFPWIKMMWKVVPRKVFITYCGILISSVLVVLSHIVCLLITCVFQDIAYYMSRRMRKPTICIGENKGTDQLRSNCEADQHLYFHYSDSTIPLLLKSKLSLLACCCDCTGQFMLELVGN